MIGSPIKRIEKISARIKSDITELQNASTDLEVLVAEDDVKIEAIKVKKAERMEKIEESNTLASNLLGLFTKKAD